jgi:hypothetical protein
MIPLLGARTCTLHRFGPPTLDAEGRAVRPASSPLPIIATVQPASSRVAQWLPDGIRLDDTIEVVAYVEIRAATEGQYADRLDVPGLGHFDCIRVTRSSAFAGQPQHWRAWAVRVGSRRP